MKATFAWYARPSLAKPYPTRGETSCEFRGTKNEENYTWLVTLNVGRVDGLAMEAVPEPWLVKNLRTGNYT